MRAGLALMLLFAAGCASNNYVSDRLAYTDGLAGEWKLTPGIKQRLQYFTSHEIRLVRAASGGERGIADGRLVSATGQVVDEVVIPAGTPGVVLGSGPDWMAVSFEPNSYLYFVSQAQRRVWNFGEDGGVPGRYFLLVPNWNGKSGTVKLGDQMYTAVQDSARAYLLVERDSFSDVDAREVRLPGRVLR
mgnify:CR=1 FL=1